MGQSTPKDTLRNIRETGEFVVNVVTFAVAEAMNLTSGEYDPSVDEFALARLTTRPSQVVRRRRLRNLRSASNANSTGSSISALSRRAAAW